MALASVSCQAARCLYRAVTTTAVALVLACGGADRVSGPAPVASVSVAIASSSLVVGATTQATATVRDADGRVLEGRSISWSSSDAEIASVSSTGEITAVRQGSAEIKATSEGKDGSATLIVVATPVASVTVTLGAETLALGSTTTAAAALKDANGNELTGRSVGWSSSDQTVATVSDAGVVTAVKVGSATITATSEGKSGSAPVTVYAPLVSVRQRSLSLGGTHSCAIAVDGSTYCWGNNHNGQLGTNAGTWITHPNPVSGGYKFLAISAASNTTYALLETGDIYCWGGVPCDPNAGNTLDEGNGPAVTTPKHMTTTRTIDVLGPSRGDYTAMCGIGTGNVAYCWGANKNGELGLGFASNDTVFAPNLPVVGNHAFSDIAGATYHACAVTTAGSAYCWGTGSHGELGDGSGTSSAEPRAVAGGLTFKMIAGDDFFSCGLTTTGQAYCWGDNGGSQLGTSTGNCLGNTTPCSAVPVAVSGGHVFDFIAARYNRACGVTPDGDIYCWGSGFGATPTRFRSVLANEAGGVRFSIVDIGGGHICATSTTGDIWCRGNNKYGQLGNGTFADTNVDEPAMVVGGIKFRTP